MSFIPTSLLLIVAAVLAMPSAASEPESTDVVIVGAGVAGLVTAYELRKRGLRTHVLEAKATIGGRTATADYGNGLRAEYGIQEIWSNNPLVDIAQELGTELTLGYERCAHSSFMAGGRIYPDIYDGTMRGHWNSFLTPVERDALEDWLAAAEHLHERATTQGLADPAIRALQDLSYKQWVASDPRLSRLAREWLRLHVEVELASDWGEISALYALLEMDRLFDGGAACYTIDGGNARLTEALAMSSGPVTTSARVTHVGRQVGPDDVESLRVSYFKDNRLHSLNARRVVLAVPFYRLHQINIEPPLSAAHQRALQTLRRGHYVVVHLIMDADHATLSTDNGIEVSDAVLSNGPLGCIYGVVSTSDGKAVFSLLLYGEHARAFHMAPRSDKVRELLAELDEMQPAFAEHVDAAYVYTYHPAALPSWGPGRSPLDEHSALLREPTDGLYLVGDYTQGGHSDSAARSAIRAALRIASELAPAAGGDQKNDSNHVLTLRAHPDAARHLQ